MLGHNKRHESSFQRGGILKVLCNNMKCNQLLDLDKDEAILMVWHEERFVFCSMSCAVNMFEDDEE